MNELSTEVKAKEIHENAQFWHNRAEHNLYRFFLEVKEIRDNRYYKELGYSSFEDYSLDAWNIGRKTMDDRIKIANTFSEEDFENYSSQFGYKKTLLLTSMEEPQREQTLTEGIPTEQGYKPYDEATQKEIADYKRNAEEMEHKAKEYEKQLKSAHQENDILQSKLETAENQEPQVIEKYTEPEDYQDIKKSLERMEEINAGREKHVENLQQEIADMREKRSEMDKKSKEYDRLNQAINEMNGRLDKGQKRIAAQKEVYDLVRNANRLIEEVAPLSYLVNTEEILDNEYATKPIKKLIKDLNDITKRLNESINQKEILEVN